MFQCVSWVIVSPQTSLVAEVLFSLEQINVMKSRLLDPVCTVPDPHGHDIKLNSSTTSGALKLTIVLQNLTTSSYGRKW